MKKKLALLLLAVGTMSLVFTGCGDKKAEPTAQTTEKTELGEEPAVETATEPAEEPTEELAEGDSEASIEQVYADSMSEVYVAYDELLTSFVELVETYDGSEDWWTSFNLIQATSEELIGILKEIEPMVPETYVDSHKAFSDAVTMYKEGFDIIGSSADKATPEEQQATYDEGVALVMEADKLYQSAIE